jgi:hypothetical protein
MVMVLHYFFKIAKIKRENILKSIINSKEIGKMDK